MTHDSVVLKLDILKLDILLLVSMLSGVENFLPFSYHTGELSSGAHGGDESRDGGEEQEKNSMSVLEELSLCGESMTLPRHVDHQHYQHHHHHLQRHPQQQKQYFNHSSSQPPSKSLYHAPFHPPSLQVWHHPPNQHKPIQPHMYQSPNYLPLGQPCSEHRDPIQPLYYQPSHHPPNPPFLQHSHQPLLQHTHSPTSQSLSQQLHYHPHYQMPVQPMYMYPPHLSSPSLSEHAFQLNHWTSIFQSSQMPSSHCYHTPFYPFYQASFQTPAQPVNAYQSSSPLSPPPHLVSCPDPTLSRGKGSGDH